jgi:hypothetical protein
MQVSFKLFPIDNQIEDEACGFAECKIETSALK